MASPQKENGYTPIANELILALARAKLPSSFYQVLMAVFRFSYGFRKKVAFFKPGQLAKTTEMDRRYLNKVMKEMKHRNLLDYWREGYSVSIKLNKNYEEWLIVVGDNDDLGGVDKETHDELDQSSYLATTNCRRQLRRLGSCTYIERNKRNNKKIRARAREAESGGFKTPSGSPPETPLDDLETLIKNTAPPEVVKKHIEKVKERMRNYPTCPSCNTQAPDIHKGGKCPYCGKWV